MLNLARECVIGRSDQCDLVLRDVGISRRHARLFEMKGQFFAEDLGSTNGVMIGEEELSEARALNEGDVLSLGTVELRFLALTHSQITLAAENYSKRKNAILLTCLLSKEQFWGWLQLELTQAKDGEFCMMLVDIDQLSPELLELEPETMGGRVALVLSDVPLRRALAMAERLQNRLLSYENQEIRASLCRGDSPPFARWTFLPVREELSQAELSRLDNLPARVAHELNTPLGAVSMAVEMAAERLENPEKASNLLDRALVSIEQMRMAILKLSESNEWGE
jgi:signal transduction histidine kinase